MIEQYKQIIKDRCHAPENKFGTMFFEQHVLMVEKYARMLADILKADKEVVLAAVYLHDMAAVSDFSRLAEHPVLGAAMAEPVLKDSGFPREKISAVQRCIETHSVPVAIGQGTLEQVCMSNADAMSQIANPLYWLYYAFNVRQFDYGMGRTWYNDRINTNWAKLIEPAQTILEPEYAYALQLFRYGNE
jgi:uncharacterized protein